MRCGLPPRGKTRQATRQHNTRYDYIETETNENKDIEKTDNGAKNF